MIKTSNYVVLLDLLLENIKLCNLLVKHFHILLIKYMPGQSAIFTPVTVLQLLSLYLF
jgi:hypothetical protein